ncbi:MAG: TPM domain-containing protein [Rhizobiaceae bacterium]
MRLMHENDHRAVSAAIRNAEKHTDGEIYAVIARRSDDYFAPAAFAVSLAAVFSGFALAVALHFYWVPVDAFRFMTAFALAYGAALIVLLLFPRLCIRLVPRQIAHGRAHMSAASQFLARNIHATKARTGVLLFVSVDEHYAEVIADEAINDKVEQAQWDRIVGMLIDSARRRAYANGFLDAIEASGALLAAHFPKSAIDTNELDDHVVEL